MTSHVRAAVGCGLRWIDTCMLPPARCVASSLTDNSLLFAAVCLPFLVERSEPCTRPRPNGLRCIGLVKGVDPICSVHMPVLKRRITMHNTNIHTGLKHIDTTATGCMHLAFRFEPRPRSTPSSFYAATHQSHHRRCAVEISHSRVPGRSGEDEDGAPPARSGR